MKLDKKTDFLIVLFEAKRKRIIEKNILTDEMPLDATVYTIISVSIALYITTLFLLIMIRIMSISELGIFTLGCFAVTWIPIVLIQQKQQKIKDKIKEIDSALKTICDIEGPVLEDSRDPSDEDLTTIKRRFTSELQYTENDITRLSWQSKESIDRWCRSQLGRYTIYNYTDVVKYIQCITEPQQIKK